MNKDKKPREADILPEDDLPTEIIAETENYSVWLSQEPDGEIQYHLELGAGNITVHFFQEEWDEFVSLMRNLLRER
ncbi:MAG: hypothetical protein DYG88_15285 [Chloroflexi bacterium CFX4]|nr:hypothetical protein [Chloroflexi bacterium CFX4]MDL1922131.1 hypothetical protein [Chloroflexi bacterium CFX3]